VTDTSGGSAAVTISTTAPPSLLLLRPSLSSSVHLHRQRTALTTSIPHNSRLSLFSWVFTHTLANTGRSGTVHFACCQGCTHAVGYRSSASRTTPTWTLSNSFTRTTCTYPPPPTHTHTHTRTHTHWFEKYVVIPLFARRSGLFGVPVPATHVVTSILMVAIVRR
jgi:hypothetical protein